MILSDLKNYVQQRRQVSLTDIMNHFDIDEQTARSMLDIWIRKGKVIIQMATHSCGSSCHKCSSASTEYFCWQDALQIPISLPRDCPTNNCRDS